VVPAQVYPAPIITPAPAPVTTTVIVPPSAPVVVAATTPTYTKEYRSDVVQTRVFLQPIAPPQPLGLWGYSIGTFIVGAYLAGWFSQNNGNALSIIAPFAFFTGGLLQAIAAHQAFRARCAFSTVSFGIWSSLWFAFAFMWMMVLLGALAPVLGYFPEHAIWWVPLIVLSAMLTGAALLENLGVMLVYFFVTIASVLMAASYFWHPDDNCNISNPNDSCIYRNYRLREAAGYFFVFSAAAAMYTGLWFLLSFMSGRDLVPNYRFTWSEKRPRIHGGENEPGVKKCM
jgi:succinate-acetate transporter protein